MTQKITKVLTRKYRREEAKASEIAGKVPQWKSVS